MMAVSSVANDGRMVIPHVLYAMVRDGRQYNVPAQFGRFTPSRKQPQIPLTEMLAISLEAESSLALVPGYRVAGKTGTAQIPVDGIYDTTKPIHPSSAGVLWMTRSS
jgi:cell division protein FtsI/penicillin-binding protein 2